MLARHISELDNAAVQGRVQLDDINSGDTDERRSQCFDKWTDYSGSGCKLKSQQRLFCQLRGWTAVVASLRRPVVRRLGLLLCL